MRAIFGGIGVCHLFIDEKLDYKNVLPILKKNLSGLKSINNFEIIEKIRLKFTKI